MNTLISLRSSSKKLNTLASVTTSSPKHLLIPSSSAVTTPPPAYHRQFANQFQSFHPKFGFSRSLHGSQLVNIRACDVFTQAAGFSVTADPSYDRDLTPSSDGIEISNLGISQDIIYALAKKGITKLFPFQRAVLEVAMQGRDIIGRAMTGTEKTLAFGIPILNKIIQYNEKHGKERNPLAIVIVPTVELALQAERELYECAPNLDTLCVFDGMQCLIDTLDCGVDVIVCTPGCIIDLLQSGVLNSSEIKFVVLDEADQMLKVGRFVEYVDTILEEYLPKQRQTMMFSATMPNWFVKLAQKYLKTPLIIDLVGDSDQKMIG